MRGRKGLTIVLVILLASFASMFIGNNFIGSVKAAGNLPTVGTDVAQDYDSHSKNYLSQFPAPVTIRPSGDSIKNWTGWSGGLVSNATHWDKVDEAVSNGDTDYIAVAAATVGKNRVDIFTMADPAAQTWDAYSVRLTIMARNTLSSDEQIRMLLRIGGINYLGSLITPTTTYTAYTSEWGPTNPNTNQLWTWTDINSLEAGVQSVQQGGSWTGELRVTQVYVDVLSYGPARQADDGDFAAKAGFTYSDSPGLAQKALEVYNFTAPAGVWSGNAYSPVSAINSVDFYMRYNVSENTGARDDYYRIVYRVSPSTTPQVLVNWRNDYTTSLYVNGFTNTYAGWIREGASPYLGASDYPTNYVHTAYRIRPDGNGLYNVWTGTYVDWDEADPNDGDTTYVTVNSNNQNESSTLGNPVGPPAWAIGGVTVTIVAKYGTTPANDQVRLMLVIGGKGYNGTGSLYSLTGTYKSYSATWDTNPAYAVNATHTLSGPWNFTAINNLQAGVRSQQVGGTFEGNIRITQMYVDVLIADTTIGNFDFTNLGGAYDGGKILLELNSTGDGDDIIDLYLYNGTWNLAGNLIPEKDRWTWQSFDVTQMLTSTALVNGAQLNMTVRIGGAAGELKVDSARLRLFNNGFVNEPLTVTWANKPEPNNGTWEWADINNIRIAVEANKTNTKDAGCRFFWFEVGVTVYSPTAKLKLSATTVDTTATPPLVETIRPMADALGVNFLVFPAAPTTHFDKVDEVSQNGDTDYIYRTTTGGRDTFNLTDPVGPPAWGIGTVRVVAYARLTVASGTPRLFGVLRIPPNGVLYYTGVGYALTTSYAKYSWDWAKNPSTGNDWTWADITSLQAGVSQTGASGELRVTQVYIDVIGPKLSLTLWSEGVSDLWGYTLIARYNTSVLTAVGSSGVGVFATGTPSVIDDAQGLISFGFTMPSGTEVGSFGNVTIGRIFFVPDLVGTSNIDLSDTKLTMTSANPLSHNVYDLDVEVTAVTPRNGWTLAFQGYPRNITVTVQNKVYRTYNASFVLYRNASVIGTKSIINLASGASTTFDLRWNTTSVPYGNYTLTGVAELSTNPKIGDASSGASASQVRLTIPGDVTGDKIVDVFDILKLKFHRSGPPPGPGGYNIDVDINGDGFIDVFDILIAKAHLGQSW